MKKTIIPYILSILFAFNAVAQQPITPQLYKSADQKKMNQWVDSVFNQMSIDERVGQLFIPIVPGDGTEANKAAIEQQVKKLHLGGLLFSKGTPIDQVNLTNAAQRVAKVPLMITLDGEWGLSMRLKNTTSFPKNMMLGAIQNDSLMYWYGKEVARQCKLMGIHVNFAPDMDVNSNPANPVIGYRSFGEDPKRVAQLGIMYAKGLESEGVMAVAKHFPGHGDTSTDSHKTLPLVDRSREELNKVELYPFKEYIKAGLSGVMIGHLNVPALDSIKQPSSLSKAIGTDLLKKELRFGGLTFTDGLQMKGVADEKDFCVRALQAGNDILLGPTYLEREYKAVRKAVEDGTLSDSLVNAKCKKILAYKYILNVHKNKQIETISLIKNLNTPYADWINNKLNEKAITVLKDQEKILPLQKLDKRKIAVVTIGASSTDKTFATVLAKYDEMKVFRVVDGAGLLAIKKTLQPYNTLIISIHSTNVNADAAIKSVSQDKNTILTFFINPYKLSGYSSSIATANAVVLGYENTKSAQDYAAQGIFGGNDVNGKLPVSVKGLYTVGDGISTDKTRLSYGSPEDVGIPSANLDSIAAIVNEGIKAEAFPGCQILIAKNGVVIYQHSFGTFEYKTKRMVEDDDIYDLASMTKATATLPAVMALYDKKKISLTTHLSQYIPALKGTDKSDISVRQALFHESRLPAFIPYYMNAIDTESYNGRLFNRERTPVYTAQFDENTWARTDYRFKSDLVSAKPKSSFLPIAEDLYINKAYKDTIIGAIAATKLNKRAGYLYSCLNFILLQQVVEAVSKTDLNTFVQNNFYQQLGATTTTYNPLTKFDKDQIVPTEKDDFLRKQLLQGYVHDEGAAFMGGISGNAGLFSNANDLAKLYQMMLNKGTYGGEEYVSNKTCTIFTSTQSSISRRGLGFDKPDLRTNKSSPTSISTPASTYGHTGFTGTCFWIDPDNNLIYIFLSNRVNDKRTHKELMSLGIRQRIQEEIYKGIRKSKNAQIPEID